MEVIAVRRGDVVEIPTKNPFTSTTLWGVVVTLVFGLLSKSNWWLFDKETTGKALAEFVSLVVGPLMTLWGRWNAKQPLAFSASLRQVRLPIILLVLLLTSGCGAAITYTDGVRTTYPVVATRLDRNGPSSFSPALRAAATADPITYTQAAKAWDDAAPAYRESVSNDPSLNAQRKSDWLKTADLLDRLQDAQWKRDHWLLPVPRR